tara:strand:- start:2086 stop:2616 length:531 start_codon:yes stop_codon:yes gene_type:complete
MAQRISSERKEDGLLIKIKAYYDEDKHKFFTIWVAAWTLCGLAIVSQLFTNVDSELKTMILVFFAFWAYFEYLVVKAFRWRKSGEEQFFITEEQLQYGRTYNNRGFLKPYRKDLVNKVRFIDDDQNTFVKVFSDSYWVIGGERLAFTVSGKVIPFGLRLNDKEAKKLVQLINKELD